MSKTLGWLLLGLSLAVIVGFLVEHKVYWLVVDILVIVICGAGGLSLVRNK